MRETKGRHMDCEAGPGENVRTKLQYIMCLCGLSERI